MILSDTNNTFINLAAEEYMLNHFSEDVFMLWQSRKAVVCGKHQNVCAEVNYEFCKSHSIDIARRISGGGTVFHDDGNINFTFIKTIPEGLAYAVDYKRFLDPVRDALNTLGIKTEYSQRNDLLFEGKKISGNAEHVFQKKKRVLHHGTLLFNSDLTSLGKALKPEGTYESKAVRSVQSQVTNMQSARPDLNANSFKLLLLDYFARQPHTNKYVFSSSEITEIEHLASNKFSTTEWVLHYSPAYTLEKKITAGERHIILKLKVQSGILTDIHLTTIDGTDLWPESVQSFSGMPFNENTSQLFSEFLNQNNVGTSKYILF